MSRPSEAGAASFKLPSDEASETMSNGAVSAIAFDAGPPNGLPLSCAALIDWNDAGAIPAFKKGTISGPRSGVSYSGGLGRTAAVAIGLVASFEHCRERETAERRGIRLPDEACAASLKQPSDQACGCQTRHGPSDQAWPTTRGMGRTTKQAEPRGMRLTTRGRCRTTERAEPRGMRRDTHLICMWNSAPGRTAQLQVIGHSSIYTDFTGCMSTYFLTFNARLCLAA
jgi:hypothetical protein